MKKYLKTIRIVSLCSVVALGASACTMAEPTKFKQSTVRVQPELVEHSVQTVDLSEASLVALADHYHRHGSGAVNVAVSYDPSSKVNTAMKAGDKAAEVASILRREGITDVKVNIMPYKGAKNSQSYVSYTAYNALAPEGCGMLPGVENRNVVVDESYQLGCTVDTLFARQIARPKDLLGQENAPTSDGRRAANMGEIYRGGTGNSDLGGESASD